MATGMEIDILLLVRLLSWPQSPDARLDWPENYGTVGIRLICSKYGSAMQSGTSMEGLES